MTNEEKAKEIAFKKREVYCAVVHEDEDNCTSMQECYDSALEMAAWKEQQMVAWLENNAFNYVVCNEFAEFSHYATKTMIEDFKKYMEE